MPYALCPMLHASAWRKAVGALRFIAFSWAIGYGKRADLARGMRPKSASYGTCAAEHLGVTFQLYRLRGGRLDSRTAFCLSVPLLCRVAALLCQ